MNEHTRRKFLAGTAGSATVGIAGCSDDESEGTTAETNTPETQTEEQTTTDDPDQTVDILEHDKRIGAHYYAWYWGDDGWSGRNHASDKPNSWLDDTPGTPTLGAYDTRNPDVVDRHIKWSLEHGINWWIINNGAPNTEIDHTIRDIIFESKLADNMEFTILFGGYDPSRTDDGRFDFDDPDQREVLTERFEHWEETKVHDDNYLWVDGRPTMYFWDSNDYVGDVAGAFEEAAETVDVEPYLIAAPAYRDQPVAHTDLETFDAVKDYQAISTDSAYMDRFRELTVTNQRRWAAASDHLDITFYPSVTPGFDSSVRDDGEHRVPILERDINAFRNECAALRGLADDDTLVVTSFNEWPEHTNVEPSEEEGTAYLEAIADELARADWDVPDLEYQPLTLTFSETVSEGPQELGFMAREIRVDTDDETVVESVGSLDETFAYVDGVYGRVPDEQGGSRWLGGAGQRALILVPASGAIERVMLEGRPIQAGITTTAETAEREIGSITFGDDPGEYVLGD